MINVSEPVRHAIDFALAGWGAAIFFQFVPALSGVAALALILLRIAIGVEEWRIRRAERQAK